MADSPVNPRVRAYARTQTDNRKNRIICHPDHQKQVLSSGTGMIPTWLAGSIHTPTARGIRTTRCPHCRADTLTGYDDTICALLATVDPRPLSPLGEAIALIGGARSYELRRHHTSTGRNTFAIWKRNRWQIASRKAGSVFFPQADIVAEHQCGTNLPETPTRFEIPASRSTDAGNPPF